jgi:hypothetical protein
MKVHLEVFWIVQDKIYAGRTHYEVYTKVQRPTGNSQRSMLMLMFRGVEPVGLSKLTAVDRHLTGLDPGFFCLGAGPSGIAPGFAV